MQSEARPRAEVRVPAEVRVRRFGDHSLEYRSVNLSTGGVFVATGDTLPPGTWVELGVQLGDRVTTREIVASARVMWNNDPRTPSSPSLPAGMGLKFIDLDPESREALRNYVEELRVRRVQRRTVRLPKNERPRPSRPSRGASPRGEQLPADELSPGEKRPRETWRDEALSSSELLSTDDRLGPYRIAGLLGVGGMGAVYLAEHLPSGRRVALKKLHHHHSGDPEARQRFFAEARLVNRIGHPNIVEVFDFVSRGRDHYFVMELIDGRSLGSVIADEAPIGPERLVAIARQLCDVLCAIHARDVVHRDLKPDNVLLVRHDDNDDVVKLLDFGVAKLHAPIDDLEPAHTAVGIVLGTPGYLPPEAIVGSPVDARSDIYALGVILYQLAAGRMPFVGAWGQVVVRQATETPPPPSSFRTERLPEAFDELILHCLAPDPLQRPACAAEVRDRLPAAPPSRARPRLWPRVCLAALLGLACGAVAVLFPRSPAHPPSRHLAPAAPVPDAAGAVRSTRATPPGTAASSAAPLARRTPKRANRKTKLSARERYRRAERLLERGDAATAAAELTRVVRSRPHHARAHRALGKAYLLLGRDAEGFAALAHYVALRPNAPDAARLRELIAAYHQRH